MAERHDHDRSSEDAEYLGRVGPRYGPAFDQPPIINGNYVKIVVAWASVITLVLISTFAYLWSVKDARDAHQDDEMMMLWAARAQDRETIGRMESHIEYLQKQVDRLQK